MIDSGTLTQTDFKTLFPENWTQSFPKERIFTSDEVIDAYLTGINENLEQKNKLILEKLKSNLIYCIHLTQNVIDFIKLNQFKPYSAYLKIENFSTFEVLIVVNETDYIQSHFLKIYDFVSTLETESCNDLFDVHFSFMSIPTNFSTKNFNEKAIVADGYFLKTQFVN